jgi:hypothetical protein
MVEGTWIFLFLFDDYPLVKCTFGKPHQRGHRNQKGIS